MRYRKLDENGDYTFGKGSGNFHVDQPEAVAQAISTRLKLIQGEWALDVTDGTPFSSKILGAGMVAKFDFAIQSRIVSTPGVKSIANYSSSVDPNTRAATVNCTVNTIYGQTSIQPQL